MGAAGMGGSRRHCAGFGPFYALRLLWRRGLCRFHLDWFAGNGEGFEGIAAHKCGLIEACMVAFDVYGGKCGTAVEGTCADGCDGFGDDNGC